MKHIIYGAILTLALLSFGRNVSRATRTAAFRGRISGLAGLPSMLAKRSARGPARVPAWRLMEKN